VLGIHMLDVPVWLGSNAAGLESTAAGILVARLSGRTALLTKRTKPSHDPEQNVVLFMFDQSTE
jgi:hypothetical protein